MINVVSEYREKSTDSVLEYITWLGGNFNRLNREDKMNGVTIRISNDNDNIVLDHSETLKFDFAEIQHTWYRRGDYSITLPVDKTAINNDFVEKFILDEWNFVKMYLHESENHLGKYISDLNNNKLSNLKYAKLSGFKIPSTIVTTKKSELFSFLITNVKVITKPLHNAHVGFEKDGKLVQSKGTQYIERLHLNNLDENFCPLLAQEYIEKEIEIRVFFFYNNLYPMAIFSQYDDKTKLDYRNYNVEKPNRNMPYQFIATDEQKVINFIKLSGLSTGSIDLILTKENELVFLEVNPSGQFGWISSECNYYIEQAIALYLSSKTKNESITSI
jgi:hypothetical protein